MRTRLPLSDGKLRYRILLWMLGAGLLALVIVCVCIYSAVQQKPSANFMMRLVLGLGFAVMVLSVASWRLSQQITHSILRLADGVNAVAQGRYHYRLPLPSRDELGLVTASFNDMAERLEARDWVKTTFGRYLSPSVVDALLTSPEGLCFRGERRVLTVLVVSLHVDHEQLIKSIEPATVIRMMNRYLDTLFKILLQYHGTIDDYQADTVVALFGAPLSSGDDAERAVACAVALQNTMVDFNAEQKRLGLPELYLGIGLTTEAAIVGHLGSDHRAKYGAISPALKTTVEIASCAAAGQILISMPLYGRLRDQLRSRKVVQSPRHSLDRLDTLHDVSGIEGAYQMGLQTQSAPFSHNI